MFLKKKIYKALKWSQQYTQTDMIYLARGGFWLTLGHTVTSLAALVLTWAFANLVPAKTFGTYRYVLSVVAILAIPTLSGINTAVLQAVARGKEGSFLSGLKSKLKWGTVATLGSIGVAVYYFFNGNNALGFSFLMVSAFIPLMEAFLLYEFFWQGKKRFDVQSKYRVITQIASTSIILLCLILTENIFLILLTYFASSTILNFIFLCISLKKAKPNKEEDPKTISYGKNLSLMGILGRIDNQLDKILLWHFLGPSGIAVYFIALALPLRIKDILDVIGGLAMPKLSQRTEQELKKSVPKKMFRIFLFSLPLIAIYIIFAPLIFRVLFPRYSQFVIYSQVYALTLLTFSRILPGSALAAKMKTKSLWLSGLILSPIYILLLFLLVPYFGIWGAIAAFLATELITFAVQFYFFKKM